MLRATKSEGIKWKWRVWVGGRSAWGTLSRGIPGRVGKEVPGQGWGIGGSHLDGEDERGEAETAEVGESEACQDVEERPEDEVAGLLLGDAGEGRSPPGWVQRDAHLRLLRLHGRERSEDWREVGALRKMKPSPAPPLRRPPGSQSSGGAVSALWARPPPLSSRVWGH